MDLQGPAIETPQVGIRAPVHEVRAHATMTGLCHNATTASAASAVSLLVYMLLQVSVISIANQAVVNTPRPQCRRAISDLQC